MKHLLKKVVFCEKAQCFKDFQTKLNHYSLEKGSFQVINDNKTSLFQHFH